jgi:uncharacterized protein DUF3775
MHPMSLSGLRSAPGGHRSEDAGFFEPAQRIISTGVERLCSAAYLKFLHHQPRIRSRNFKWRSGTGINVFASARDFPKFVKVGAARVHELRKVGTSADNGRNGMPELAISAEKVAFLIEKTREFDAKEAVTDPDSGSNPTDDKMIDVLEDDRNDPVAREVAAFIGALTEDEQVDLVALMRLGRGDSGIEEWEDLRREAREAQDVPVPRYLLGEPLVSDYLAEGLSAFGTSWTDAAPK